MYIYRRNNQQCIYRRNNILCKVIHTLGDKHKEEKCSCGRDTLQKSK